MFSFKPIIPKVTQLMNARIMELQLLREMKTWTTDMRLICANYEAPPSASYRRTLTLARSWNNRAIRSGPQIIGAVWSSGQIAPYNVYVRGPRRGSRRQAQSMRDRGWASITDILNENWPKEKARFAAIVKAGGR